MGSNPDGQAILTQSIARGPVAAIIAAKQFGTNAGGWVSRWLEQSKAVSDAR